MIQINNIRIFKRELIGYAKILIISSYLKEEINLLFYKLDLRGLTAKYNCFYNYLKSDIEYFMNKNEPASLIYKKKI